MKPNDRRLLKEISIVLVIKLILLYGIWFYWISGNAIKVDSGSTAEHVFSTKN